MKLIIGSYDSTVKLWVIKYLLKDCRSASKNAFQTLSDSKDDVTCVMYLIN